MQFRGDFTQFLDEHFDGYCEHFKSWMHKDDTFPISYEVLLSENSFEHIKTLLSNFQLSIKDEVLQEAIKRSQPKRLKNAPHSNRMAELEMKFIRNAKTKQYNEKKYYGAQELEIVRKKLKQYNLHELNYFPEKYHPLLKKNPWGMERW